MLRKPRFYPLWEAISAASDKVWQDALVPVNKALKQAGLPIPRSDMLAPEEGGSNDEE